MKRNFIYIFFALFSLILFQDKVYAKDVKKVCEYTYQDTLKSDGKTEAGGTAYFDTTITITIYDDGTHSGTSSSSSIGGDEDLNNWGKSEKDAPDIKSENCPDYIGVIVTGFGDRRWYGFSTSTLNSNGPKTADYGNSNSMLVYKLNDLQEIFPTYTCESESGFYVITVDTNRKTLTVDSKASAYSNLYFSISDELRESWFSEERGTNECLATVSCKEKKSSSNYKIFNDVMEASSAGYKYCEVDECTGEDCNSGQYSCTTYTKYKNEIDTLYEKIKKKEGSLDNLYKEVHMKEERLASLCKGVMASYDYSENCVKACVHLESDLVGIKEKHGIEVVGSGNGNCGISERIADWIIKIVSWVRYIIPVLLIVLSILDFMKALAADSEDDIKKAASRFIKRLIVSVVIFLLPLLLEFVLGIFGINANGFCL